MTHDMSIVVDRCNYEHSFFCKIIVNKNDEIFNIVHVFAIIDVYTVGNPTTTGYGCQHMNTNPKIVRFVICFLKKRASL